MLAVDSLTPETQAGRYEGLLRAANAIAACRDCDAAADRLTCELHKILAFDYLQLVAFERDTGKVAWQFTDVRGTREKASLIDPYIRELPRYLACVTLDRKSTRLNSSHVKISYAVFCLKKKKKR